MQYLKTFESFINEAKPYSKDEIVVFDLDDTLVITDAKIKVCDNTNGECFSLTPEEFNEYTVVNGEIGMLDNQYHYRVDKPITTMTVDEQTKEVCFFFPFFNSYLLF